MDPTESLRTALEPLIRELLRIEAVAAEIREKFPRFPNLVMADLDDELAAEIRDKSPELAADGEIPVDPNAGLRQWECWQPLLDEVCERLHRLEFTKEAGHLANLRDDLEQNTFDGADDSFEASLQDLMDKILEPKSLAEEGSHSEEGGPGEVKEYLFSWAEILECAGRKNDQSERDRIKRLNEMHEGPIITPGKGAQPKAEKRKFIEWWNSLDKRFDELKQKETNKNQTVANQYDYGKDGTVVPDISGMVKKRKGRKS